MRRMFVALGLSVIVGGCMGYQELSVFFDPADIVVPSGQVVSVYAVVSGGNGELEYNWEWSGPESMGYGDGPTFRVTPGETFVGPKEYVIHVLVTDGSGHEATAEKWVTVGSAAQDPNDPNDGNNGPAVVIHSPVVIVNPPDGDGNHDGSGNGHHDGDPNDAHHQPRNPTVDLKINGVDNPSAVTAGPNGVAAATVSWSSSNATGVYVSGAPIFLGQRALAGEASVTLDVGTWTLVATATGAFGTTPASDSVTIVIRPHSGHSQFRIISITLDPSCDPNHPYHVGDAVTTHVEYEGGPGVVHFLWPTSTVIGSEEASDTSGVVNLPTYHWPFKVDCPTAPDCDAKFWPNELVSDDYLVRIPIRVLEIGQS